MANSDSHSSNHSLGNHGLNYNYTPQSINPSRCADQRNANPHLTNNVNLPELQLSFQPSLRPFKNGQFYIENYEHRPPTDLTNDCQQTLNLSRGVDFKVLCSNLSDINTENAMQKVEIPNTFKRGPDSANHFIASGVLPDVDQYITDYLPTLGNSAAGPDPLQNSIRMLYDRVTNNLISPNNSNPSECTNETQGVNRTLYNPTRRKIMTIPEIPNIDAPNIFIHPHVNVFFLNQDKWKELSVAGNESVLNVKGRRIFPYLEFQVDGLLSNHFYSIYLGFISNDSRKYRYTKRYGWVVDGSFNDYQFCQYVMHPDEIQPGWHWTKGIVSFMCVKITNSKACSQHSTIQNPLVLLESLHSYKTKIKIVDETTGNLIMDDDVPYGEFYTVTAYQNDFIKEYKIKHNNYASSFRNKTNTKKVTSTK